MPSADDPLDYPRMIAEALRGVARQALAVAAEEGLPGEHHFLLSFRPHADGVRVPGFLAQQHPDEVTVVLQNQFWDLVVDEEAFSVTLAFGGARHRLYVPFGALTAFADPAAPLGLRFEPAPGEAGGAEAGEAEGLATAPAAERERTGDASGKTGGGEGADVVSIDRFRKS